MKQHRKPLQLPKKTPLICPKGPLKGTTEVGDKPKETAQLAKRTAALECLWNAFLELGCCGTMWSPNFEKEDYKAEAKGIITDGWIDNTALSQHLSTLELWISFSEEVKINWKTPDSVAIRTFLGRFKQNGATVPRKHFDSFRWLEMNIGLAACSSLERVKRFCDVPETHSSVSVPPAKPQIWLMLENMIGSENIFVATLAFFSVLIIISVLRPKHVQRSRLFLDKGAIGGYCIKGKSNIRRNQKPFFWAASSKSLSGRKIDEDLKRICEATGAASEAKPFVLPDLLPPRSDWSSATAFSSEPMPLQKARKLIALMLRAYGASQEAIDELFGLYAFRRILPTLVHQSNFSTEERLDVGGWTDPAANTRIAMPALYSSAHSFRQISLKTELVEMTAKALMAFHTSPDEKLINPPWDTIFAFWPKRGEIITLPLDLGPEPKKAKTEGGEKAIHEEDKDDTSSCSSASSFWKDTADPPAPNEDDEIDEPYPQELSTLEWKISTGKKAACI